MTVYGLWHGGTGYSPGDLAEDLETFTSVDDAKEAMRSRILRGYWQPQTFTYAKGGTVDTLTPLVRGSSMWIYRYDPREVHDPYPDLLLEQDDDDTIKESAT